MYPGPIKGSPSEARGCVSGAEDLARAALPRAGVAAEVDGVAGRAGGLVLDSRLGRVQVQTAQNKLH